MQGIDIQRQWYAAMDQSVNIAYSPHMHDGAPQAKQDEIYDEVDMPEYEKSRAKLSLQAAQESERSGQTFSINKKQQKKMPVKGVIAVTVIAGFLIVLILLTVFILAVVQVQLLKEAEGMCKCLLLV